MSVTRATPITMTIGALLRLIGGTPPGCDEAVAALICDAAHLSDHSEDEVIAVIRENRAARQRAYEAGAEECRHCRRPIVNRAGRWFHISKDGQADRGCRRALFSAGEMDKWLAWSPGCGRTYAEPVKRAS